jgi:hypothetical protein
MVAHNQKTFRKDAAKGKIINMISGINSNSNIWQMMNRQATQQSSKTFIRMDETPTAPPPTMAVFSKSALFSGAAAVGSGMVNAHVNWSENSTESNPIMLVNGTDVDGKQFEVEVAINKINPRSASVIEMFALDGYAAATGQPTGATRAAASASSFMSQQELQAMRDRANAFTPQNFVDALREMMETQRYHRNLNSYIEYRDLFEFLSHFPR